MALAKCPGLHDVLEGTCLAIGSALSRRALRDRRRKHVVLICRCAWHPRYQGYPLLHGVASWRGWNVRFTDGICGKCLERFRAEYKNYLQKRPEFSTAAASATRSPSQAA